MSTKEQMRQYSEDYNNRHPMRKLMSAKRSNAKRNGIHFDLKEGDVVFPVYCPVLGIKIDYEYGQKLHGPRDNSPSFDRINGAIGYVKGNVVVISWRANRIKQDATFLELEAIAAWMRGGYSNGMDR